jgi:hypothetical protein
MSYLRVESEKANLNWIGEEAQMEIFPRPASVAARGQPCTDRAGRGGEFPALRRPPPHFHPPNPNLGVFGPWITVPHGPQATSRGSGLVGACATSSFAEGKTSAGCHLRPRRRCPFLLRLDGPVSCLRFSSKRSIGYCDTFFVKHSSPVEAVHVSWCAKLTIDSASWKKMVQDALDAVAVVTFDYPC